MNNTQNVCTIALLFLLIPSLSLAAHNRGGIDRDDLDDEPVEVFPIPVLFGVELSDITPDFGDPRGGGTREHEGQDMIAPKGTPIVSPTEAIVLSTGSGANSGKYIYTANPGGETFRYMHLDHIADLDRGDKLKIGDFIGTVGDTGNAAPGQYHLHFEVRNENNKAVDPHKRLGESFSVKEKMSFMRDVFRDIRDDEAYAEFLVTTFESDFIEALKKKYNLHDDIKDALDDSDVVSRQKRLAQLLNLVDSIPNILQLDLQHGDKSGAVVLLQNYLIFRSEGNARNALSAAGATGYYGSVTEQALSEWQENQKLRPTGRWDAASRTLAK